jgi:hypothetical protein
MFPRRTLVAFTAVAAIAGGASGAVTSTATTPDSASAAVPPTINVAAAVTLLKDPVIRQAIADAADAKRLARIDTSVKQVVATAQRLEARNAELAARLETLQSTEVGLANQVARGPSGRTAAALLENIEQILRNR